MKLIYTNENMLLVGNAKNLLENEGIEVVVKNEFIGGGMGELPIFDTWPELWVEKEKDIARAMAIVAPLLSKNKIEEWFCNKCAEKNYSTFEVCWNCGAQMFQAE